MKKTFLMIALLLISFWCINVKADDDAPIAIATDPEVAVIEEEKKEQEEQEKVPEQEEKKEEVAPVRDTKAAAKTLTIEFINGRSGTNVSLGTKTFNKQYRKKLATYDMIEELPTESSKVYKEDNCDGNGLECEFTFLGWSTEDGTLIETVAQSVHSDMRESDGYVLSLYSSRFISSLYITVGNLSEDVNIKLYATWEKKVLEPPAEPELRLILYDTRTNSSGTKVLDNNYANNTETSSIYTYNKINLPSREASYFDEVSGEVAYRYNFLGWYTESNIKVTDSFVSGLGDGVKIKLANSNEPSTLYAKAENLTETKEVKLYAKWEQVKLTTMLTVNFYNEGELVLTKKYEKNNYFDNNTNPLKTYSKLNLESESIDYYDVINRGTAIRHKFLGWYTESDDLVTYSGVTVSGATIRKAYESENPSTLYIDVENLTDDVTINLYSKWETEEIELPNENYKVTIELYDTRVNSDGTKVATKVINNGSNILPYHTYNYLGLDTVGVSTITDGDYKYFFDGWYTEDGRKITSESSTLLLDDNLNLKKRYETSIDIILNNVKVPDDYDPSENPTVKLYAKWIKKKSSVTVTVHVHDDKHDLHKVEIVYEGNGGNFDEHTGGTGNGLPATYKQIVNSFGIIYLDLNKIFTAEHQNNMIGKDDYGTIDRNTLIVTKQQGVAVKYTFKNWIDSNGNVIGSDGYTLPDEDSKVIEKYEVVNRTDPSSGADIKKELAITIKGLIDMDVDEDIDNVDINIYTEWDEYTTAVLTSEYIDKISTGTGSASNPSGGVVEYKHIFADPEIKTPQPNHNFLYWKFEKPEHEDDQIDTSREYKDQDVFEYDLFYKPDKWRGTVRAYAYWQSNVTLNLYDGSKLLKAYEPSFESVSIDINPTKDYYEFIGWTDEDGNMVTDKTFYPEKAGIEPKPVVINLYAKWKQIERDITVVKEWADDNNESGKRPDSVTVILKVGEDEIDKKELSQENEWTVVFEKLPIYEGDDEIVYSVIEEIVPEGYEVAYEETENGFIIHNVLGQGDGQPDTPTNNPQTGDNIYLYLITLIVSLSGLGVCVKEYLFVR